METAAKAAGAATTWRGGAQFNFACDAGRETHNYIITSCYRFLDGGNQNGDHADGNLQNNRAPEDPLPTAYDDALAAAKWVASHAAGSGGPEPWLSEHGDFNRVFFAGDSAGANIAHNVVLRAGKTDLGSGMRIKGLLLVHPFFWGSKPVGSESTDPEPRRRTEELWRFACPGTTGVDDPWINPLTEGAPGLDGLPCELVLVTVAEKDFIRERGRAYYEGLKGSGWGGKAELLESEGENHVFHLQNPTCANAVAKMERVVAFLNCE